MIDCNESWHEGDMGVANKMALLVLGSGRTARIIACEAPKRTYLQFSMKEDMGDGDDMALFVLGSCTRSALYCTLSGPEPVVFLGTLLAIAYYQ